MKRIKTILMASMLAALTACGAKESDLSIEITADESMQASSEEVPVPESNSGQEAVQETKENSLFEEPQTGDKILIAYFSLINIVPEGADAVTHATPSVGNTEYAAMEIQRQVGGDLFAIQTVQNYPASHQECSAVTEEEMRSDARPELSTHVEDMDEYNIIYIGFPIWWYMEPMAIRTFLEEYDFTGKTVIPFCTTLGAGIGESEKNIAVLTNGATVLKGLTLRSGKEDMSEEIASWLIEIEMAN